MAGPRPRGLLVADYCPDRVRVLAHLAGDEALVPAFLGGEDVHATVAGMVWGLPPTKVDRDLRARVKMVTYGLAYGLSAFGLAQGIGIPRTGQGPDGRLLRALRQGQGVPGRASLRPSARCPFGRDGYTIDHPWPAPLPARPGLRPPASGGKMAERMALNAPIQGSSLADLIEMALVAVDQAMTDQALANRMVLRYRRDGLRGRRPRERLAELVLREVHGVYQLGFRGGSQPPATPGPGAALKPSFVRRAGVAS